MVNNIVSNFQVIGAINSNSNAEIVVETAVFNIARLDVRDRNVYETESMARIIGGSESLLSTTIKLHIGDSGKT